MSQKKAYTQPQLSVHGSVEVLTKGAASGPATDAAFPNDTPAGDLTFS